MNMPLLLVCGGRNFADRNLMFRTLDEELATHSGRRIAILQGGARGADALAKLWAINRKMPHIEHPAEWDRLGRSAGYARNTEMLNEWLPDKVIAFPGGRGTAHMVNCARNVGTHIRIIGA